MQFFATFLFVTIVKLCKVIDFFSADTTLLLCPAVTLTWRVTNYNSASESEYKTCVFHIAVNILLPEYFAFFQCIVIVVYLVQVSVRLRYDP